MLPSVLSCKCHPRSAEIVLTVTAKTGFGLRTPVMGSLSVAPLLSTNVNNRVSGVPSAGGGVAIAYCCNYAQECCS
jgi:hypothetical protein